MIRSVPILVLLAVVGASCADDGGSPAVDQPPSTVVSTTMSVWLTSTTSATKAEPSTSTSAAPAVFRSITEAEPLNLWIIGDSFLELFGPALVNRSIDTGLIDAAVDFRYVSGLSRPDYFDWPAYIAGELPDLQADAAVVMFGGNDAQDVEVGGERYDVGTDAWNELYTARVAEAMDVLLAGVDCVYWVGLPIMKSDPFTANAVTMNAAYEAEAARRPQVRYISSFELFQDEDGGYDAYLDGKLMRFTDGAHFVWNGAYRLADAVLPVIATDWSIDLED